MWRSVIFAAGLGVYSCGPASPDAGVTTSGEAATSETASAFTTTGVVGTSGEAVTGEAGSSVTTTVALSTSATEPTTGALSTTSVEEPCPAPCGDPCDMIDQDCPGASKCMPVVTEGSSTWDAYRCMPLAAEVVSLGEPCAVEGWWGSGLDNCALGLVCWALDEPQVPATCLQICGDGNPRIECEDPFSTCLVLIDAPVMLCEAVCDPLAPNCPEGEVCVFDENSRLFAACGADASGAGGAMFDECESSPDCDPGLACVAAELAAQCQGDRCCVSLCDPDAPEPCPGPAQTCVPYEEQWGFEYLGACVVP